MKSRITASIAFVVYCFTVFGVVGVRALLAPTNPTAEQPEMVTVLVTKDKLPIGTRIVHPEEVFTEKQFLKGQEPKRALALFDQLKGRVLNKTLLPGSFITVDDLLTPEWRPSSGLPKGMRAITIRVPPLDIFLPRNRVDVLAVTRKDGEPEIPVLVHNVVLLAFNMGPSVADGIPFNEAILMVTDEEAEILCVAADRQLRIIYHPADNN
jgi:Flp pilus assembly protein CpaB